MKSSPPVLAALLLFSSAVSAQAVTSSAKNEIEQQYHKSCVAAELKYVDGVFSIRSATFRYMGRSRAFTQAGARNFLETIFRQALRVREKKVIVNFSQQDASHVRCQIVDTLELTLPATLPKPAMIATFESNSTDEWIKVGNTWEMTGSEQTKISSTQRAETPDHVSGDVPKK